MGADLVQQQALKSAVHDLGIGFLMVGGQNSLGPAVISGRPIQVLSPVSMDVTQKSLPQRMPSHYPAHLRIP